MPILNIRALPQSDRSKVSDTLKRTAIAISEIYGCEPQHVWATWQDIEPGYYVEGDNTVAEQPAETHPPICELICFEGKPSEQIEEILKIAASTLGEALSIPGNVFITYQEFKSGQVFAGDGIVGKKG